MDKKPVLAVVIFVGLFALAALGCVTFLISDGASETAIAVIGTPMGVALGVLGTLLSSTRYTQPEPQAVKIEQPPAEPVPTIDANAAAEAAARVALGHTGPGAPLPDGDSIDANTIPGYATAPDPNLDAAVAEKAAVDTMGTPPGT